MTRTRLGLEWRDRILTLVELEGRGDAWIVARSCERTWRPDERVTAAGVDELLRSAGVRSDVARLVVAGGSLSLKPLRLPPVDRALLLPLLRNEGDSYFLLPSGPRSYGVFGNGAEPQPETRWVAAAPASDVEALIAAFEASGVHVEYVTAAVCVYREASRFLGRTDAVHSVLRCTPDSTEWVMYDDEGLSEARWAPASDAAPLHRSVARSAESATTVILADPDAAPEVGAAATRPELDRSGTFAGALGAALASDLPLTAPDLLPTSVHERRTASRRTLTGGLAAATAILLLLWGWQLSAERNRAAQQLERELQAARTAATPVMDRRADLALLSRRVETFRRVTNRPGYPAFLNQLGRALPADAWLVSLVSTTPDEVVITGFAASATGVLTALSDSLAAEQIDFAQPIRKVTIAADQVESFTLRVRRHSAGTEASDP